MKQLAVRPLLNVPPPPTSPPFSFSYPSPFLLPSYLHRFPSWFLSTLTNTPLLGHYSPYQRFQQAVPRPPPQNLRLRPPQAHYRKRSPEAQMVQGKYHG